MLIMKKMNFNLRRIMNINILLMLIIIGTSIVEAEEECSCESKKSLKTKEGVKAATVALVGTYGATTALGSSVVGFTAAGIAKGSIAAFIQSQVGTIGGFSLLQSLGATGAFAATAMGPIGLAVLGAAGAAYMFSSGNDHPRQRHQGCVCESASEKESSCVEPATSKSNVCSGHGICDFDAEDEKLYCTCHPGFGGTYCEVNKKHTSSSNSETTTKFTRCMDTFVQNCLRCLIQRFAEHDPKNCYEQCNWKRKSTLKNDQDRPDVGTLNMRQVVNMSVIEGTECPLQINASCTTVFKYAYEHTEDYLDQLVVYFSPTEIQCKIDVEGLLILTVGFVVAVIILNRN